MKNKRTVRRNITPGWGYQPIDDGIEPINPPTGVVSTFELQKRMDEKRKRRKCEVDGRSGSFIQFAEEEQVYITVNSFMKQEQAKAIVDEALRTHVVPANCCIDKARRVIALVEYGDGTVAKVEPESIRFTSK